MIRTKKNIFLLLFFLLSSLAHTKPPQLTPRDTRIKIEEILKAHAAYKELSLELVKRSLENYLIELDPFKTYFIDNEILKWTSPSDELLQAFFKGYKNSDFQ